MGIAVDENSLKQGVLTLVVGLADIIRETLERQAIRRLDAGDLTEAELERLGDALRDLEVALNQIKKDHGLEKSVADLLRGLDDVVDDVVDKFLNPTRWTEASK
jgi:hypothetical protein